MSDPCNNSDKPDPDAMGRGKFAGTFKALIMVSQTGLDRDQAGQFNWCHEDHRYTH